MLPVLLVGMALGLVVGRQTWQPGPQVTSVSVNGAVVAMDLGNLAVGQYVVLIRQVFSLPPDPRGLVETWKALGIEVF